jgi:hypothetical protein
MSAKPIFQRNDAPGEERDAGGEIDPGDRPRNDRRRAGRSLMPSASLADAGECNLDPVTDAGAATPGRPSIGNDHLLRPL